MNQASAVTIIEDSINRIQNFSTASLVIHNTDKSALKPKCLKEKYASYISHKNFISQCIKNKLVPKGLDLTYEPTIGNYDQDFIDNWYSDFKDFSLVLAGQVVSFCDKTTDEIAIKISDTELIQTTNLSQTITKNVNTASMTNRQQENISLITIINLVEQTMTTLSKYGEQLKTQLDFSLTQQ